MQTLFKKIFFVMAVALGCWQCTPPEPDTPLSTTHGYRPVYGSQEEVEVKRTSPKPLIQPGKIGRYQGILLVNERNRGIHIFDNSDPSAPEPISFIQILGNTDFAIKNNILYANHLGNIVSVDLNDYVNITKTGSLQLQQSPYGALPPKRFYFECIEPSKGVVLNWEFVERKNMDCYALR